MSFSKDRVATSIKYCQYMYVTIWKTTVHLADPNEHDWILVKKYSILLCNKNLHPGFGMRQDFEKIVFITFKTLNMFV